MGSSFIPKIFTTNPYPKWTDKDRVIYLFPIFVSFRFVLCCCIPWFSIPYRVIRMNTYIQYEYY